MVLSYAALSLLAVIVAGGVIFLARRTSSTDDRDLGSVSTSWLDEHKSGRQ